MKTYKVPLIAQGVATIHAETKAAAKRRARANDYDAYELELPQPQITHLAENDVVPGALGRIRYRVVFKWARAGIAFVEEGGTLQ